MFRGASPLPCSCRVLPPTPSLPHPSPHSKPSSSLRRLGAAPLHEPIPSTSPCSLTCSGACRPDSDPAPPGKANSSHKQSKKQARPQYEKPATSPLKPKPPQSPPSPLLLLPSQPDFHKRRLQACPASSRVSALWPSPLTHGVLGENMWQFRGQDKVSPLLFVQSLLHRPKGSPLQRPRT